MSLLQNASAKHVYKTKLPKFSIKISSWFVRSHALWTLSLVGLENNIISVSLRGNIDSLLGKLMI
jgi:hypothetical protein